MREVSLHDAKESGSFENSALAGCSGLWKTGLADVYVTAQDYVDNKRQLALNLLTEPRFITITTTDPSAASVIRAIGLNQPLSADRILQPLTETTSTEQSRAVIEYDMDCSYLDNSELHDLSWDEFHRWYSTAGYIHGQIVNWCLDRYAKRNENFVLVAVRLQAP